MGRPASRGTRMSGMAGQWMRRAAILAMVLLAGVTGWVLTGLVLKGLVAASEGRRVDGASPGDRPAPTLEVRKPRSSRIASGDSHTCALSEAGVARCWGDNEFGQLGNGTTTESPFPMAVVTRTALTQITAGGDFTCGLAVDGAAWCWGKNETGQLGDLTTSDRDSPVAVSGGHRFAAITAGYAHACGLTRAGAAWCWGGNQSGQLGDGTDDDRGFPVAVRGPLPFTAISAGGWHTCGVAASGDAWCWGDNELGMLGVGNEEDSATPVAVSGPYRFLEVVAGRPHTCGLTPSGVAYCWGGNRQGEVGDGTTERRSSPVAVQGGTGITALALGAGLTCAVRADRSMHCWGMNGPGWGENRSGLVGGGTARQLDVTPVAVPVPAAIIEASVGENHACALAPGGEAYCWGWNNKGQIGDGTFVDRLVPTVEAGRGVPVVSKEAKAAVTRPTGFTKIATGASHSCALSGAGAAWCWGSNDDGQLGDGTTTSRPSMVAVSGGVRFVDIRGGSWHTCALDDVGAAWCWGKNDYGQLGDGTTTSRRSPVEVSGGLHFVDITAGEGHSCGLTAAGAAYCWGRRGSASAWAHSAWDWGMALLPQAVHGLPKLAAIHADGENTCGAAASGTAWCWELDQVVQLGGEVTANLDVTRPVPSAVASSPHFREVARHVDDRVCATTVDDQRYCWNWGSMWGAEGSRAGTRAPILVGDDRRPPVPPENRSGPSQRAPILVGDDGHPAREFAGSRCATPGDGSLWCQNRFWWSYEVDAVERVPLPAAIAQASGGNGHTCAISTEGAVYCWGWNLHGEVGDGTITSSDSWYVTPPTLVVGQGTPAP